MFRKSKFEKIAVGWSCSAKIDSAVLFWQSPSCGGVEDGRNLCGAEFPQNSVTANSRERRLGDEISSWPSKRQEPVKLRPCEHLPQPSRFVDRLVNTHSLPRAADLNLSTGPAEGQLFRTAVLAACTEYQLSVPQASAPYILCTCRSPGLSRADDRHRRRRASWCQAHDRVIL